jgi:hypothetical protein
LLDQGKVLDPQQAQHRDPVGSACRWQFSG